MFKIVATTTFISDTIIFVRNDLNSSITDPISGSRPSDSQFVISSYPKRNVAYPIITVRNEGPADIQKMGMRSELSWVRIPLEIRIWSKSEAQKDKLTEQVLNRLRTNQYGTNSTSDTEGIHDYTLISATPVDEAGESGVKSMVLRVQYSFVLGS